MFERGDIVEVYFDLPRAKETKLHPAIILSNDKVSDSDELYVCVMVTSNEDKDVFTFEIESSMLDNPLKKSFSQARCHLITYVDHKHFEKRKLSTMKKRYVDMLVDRIYSNVLT